jgi:hypothetical protein
VICPFATRMTAWWRDGSPPNWPTNMPPDRLREHEEHLQSERTAFAAEEARIKALDRLIQERKSRIKSEEAALKALPDGDLYLELQEQKKRLAAESSRLTDIGNTVDSALRNRVQKARHWVMEVKKAPLPEPSSVTSLGN